MHPIKYLWGFRALFYKLFFKKIGNYTYIGKPLFIEGCKNISIGNRTRIFPNIRIEAIGSGIVEIGNNCAIEQNVHITSGGILKIEDDVTIAANTCITNIDHEYREVDLSVMDQGVIISETIIGRGSFLGYNVSIQSGTHLGKHCVVGAHSLVKGDFPDYSVLVGCPAKVIKRFNPKKNIWEKMKERR